MADPLVAIIDVETTGVNPDKDRIVEFAVQQGLEPGGYLKVWRINPGIPIPKAASAVHGITDEDVRGEPPFPALVPVIRKIFSGAEVIVGYNVEFDLRCIDQELIRAGEKPLDLQKKTVVDPLKIWRHFEPRKLEDAVKKFVGEKHSTAHSAGGDVEATGKVLMGMLKTFGISELNWKELQNILEPGRDTWVGPTSHFKWENDCITVNFGKNRGKDFYQIAQDDADYLTWLLKTDFPPHIKELIQVAKIKTRDEFIIFAVEKYRI